MHPTKRHVSYRIAPALPADVGRLQELETDSFSSDRLSRRQMLYHLHNPRAVFLTVREDNGNHSVLGYALILRAKNRSARLYSIAVAKEFRGHGLGKILCRAGLDVLRDAGEKKLLLEVDANDRATIGFYERLGFETTGLLPAYYEDGRDALKMQVLL
ncbi:MAG: GNAT family N-acetyltransferase [Pseudomonadota bacterium]|nr:N-acetyltransferase [Pseudomonadota bacterium]QKK05659.1 MAG: GNAT family N-acetyltransferase [Pseudomonadota bacterium]